MSDYADNMRAKVEASARASVAFARASDWGRLYDVASRLAAYLGAYGTVEAKSDLGALLLEALRGIDGDNYCPGLMPSISVSPAVQPDRWVDDPIAMVRALASAPAVTPTPQQVSDYLNGLSTIERAVAEREAAAVTQAAVDVMAECATGCVRASGVALDRWICTECGEVPADKLLFMAIHDGAKGGCGMRVVRDAGVAPSIKCAVDGAAYLCQSCKPEGRCNG